MITLNPREYFPITRGLEDHTDTSTYYVRAFIRNSRTDALIATVDLEDQGDGHRFMKKWRVVADGSGEGMYITIITSVYTDANHTTKSLYGDSYDTYLIQDRPNPFVLGGPGGADVDYKKIEKMIASAVKKIPAPEKVEIPEVDLGPIQAEMEGIKKALAAIKMPEIKEVDLSGIVKKVDILAKKIESIKLPEVNLAPVLDSIKGQNAGIEKISEKIEAIEIPEIPDNEMEFEYLNKKLRSLEETLNQAMVILDPPPKKLLPDL